MLEAAFGILVGIGVLCFIAAFVVSFKIDTEDE